MAEKKTAEAVVNGEQSEPRFSKEQLLAANCYAARKDLVNALLEENKRYSKKEVDALIEKYMKGTVK